MLESRRGRRVDGSDRLARRLGLAGPTGAGFRARGALVLGWIPDGRSWRKGPIKLRLSLMGNCPRGGIFPGSPGPHEALKTPLWRSAGAEFFYGDGPRRRPEAESRVSEWYGWGSSLPRERSPMSEDERQEMLRTATEVHAGLKELAFKLRSFSVCATSRHLPDPDR